MHRVFALMILATLATSARNPAPPRPDVPVPRSFRNVPADAAGKRSPSWWKAFSDPLLDELMDRVVHANLDVRSAGARLVEANAARGVSRSALLPDIGTSASTARLRGGFNQGVIKVPDAPGSVGKGSFVTPFETSIVTGGFNMRWEADVFGGLRKSLKASNAAARAAEADVRAVQVIVRGEVARNYIEMRGAENQIVITRANIASEKELLDLVRARADAGLASDLDVERQTAQVASLAASLPDLDVVRLQAVHRIAVLLGEDPSALRDRLSAEAPELQEPPIPEAVPSDLLKQRPDIRRAEAEIAAAYARAGAARADLYPKFVISGLSGRQSTDFSGLTVGAGNFFSVGPGISLPIFSAGRIRSNIRVQDARLEQAVRAYEHEVLSAFEETENAFVAVDRAGQRRQELEMGLAAADRSIEIARELYLRGLGDFLAVLDAQRQRFEFERQIAACETSKLTAAVALYKSLGE